MTALSMNHPKSHTELLKELAETQKRLQETQYQLDEANDTLDAIRNGQVDALIITGQDGPQLYTLESADLIYRIFIEQMTEGAVTLNAEGNITYCNSRFSEWLKLSLEKVIGKPFEQFVVSAKKIAWKELFSDAWAEDLKGETCLESAIGTEIPVLLSFKILSLNEGSSMSIIITDLTQQKRQQNQLEDQNQLLEAAQNTAALLNATLEQTVRERTEKLYEKQEQLERILETMAEGVGIMDTLGRLTYTNPMAQKIFGLERKDMMDRSYNDPKWENLKLDGTVLPKDEHPIWLTMVTGEPVFDFEIAIKSQYRDLFYISVNAAPIRDESGKIVAAVGTFMDVTNRRLAIQQKDEFISVASHELKTPVTSLKASLQLLERMKNKLTPVAPQLIDQSVRSLKKVSVLINDLLNATQLKEGQIQLKKSRFKISSLVKDCCEQFTSLERCKIIPRGSEELELHADYDKIEQVLINLINNALKYAANSDEILIIYEENEDQIKVSVSDQGQGIDQSQLPHLFERFYRAEKNGNKYSGLGLGLYICSEIIKRHHGTMGAESVAGEGSTFWFSLPVDEQSGN